MAVSPSFGFNRSIGRRIISCLVVTLAGLAATSAGMAAASGAPVACDLDAYLANADPAGTNVRSGPGSAAPVILRAPADHEAIAAVTGFHDGWFRVERLEQAGTGHDQVLLAGRQGWIHRSGLRVDVAPADPTLRQHPRADSRIVRRLQGEQEGVVLLGCSGAWAKVRVGDDTGWLSPAGQCANPLTTCP